METADDPDPGGSLHPTVFYGLWPRVTADDPDAAEPAEPEPAPGLDS
jgi:hypothetical protein